VRLLIVKTSSMGDVVHAMPVVADILRQRPETEIDWLVEAPYAAIPQMHPGVRRVLPMAWRKWRSRLLHRATWQAMGELRRELQRGHYDLVLDLQGLSKSALWARQAGAPVAGYDKHSGRDPLASRVYQHRLAVSLQLQAVDRCRQLAAGALGYQLPPGPPDFGLRPPSKAWAPGGPYAVLIPNASRREKLWPERHWVSVGKRLKDLGWTPLVLWGHDSEQSLAENIAASCEGDVPPFLRVGEMAAVLAGAQHVVGLDTGFTHLAAAIGRPTLGIYCDHDPGLAGITGPGRVASIGGKGMVPSRNEVLALLEKQLQGSAA
jgi:heptosyltransferase I